MFNKYFKKLILYFFILFLPYIILAQEGNSNENSNDFLQPLPNVSKYLYDELNILSTKESNQINDDLHSFALENGSQIVVVNIASTLPEPIEQYSIRLVEKLNIGRKDYDDGILLLIAFDDRVARIEVGYGLEGAIPDLYAKQIIDNSIIPYFSSGDYYTGIVSAIDLIKEAILGENLFFNQQSNTTDVTPISRVSILLFMATFILAMLSIKPKKLKIIVCIILGVIAGGTSYYSFSLDSMVLGGFFGFFFSLIGFKGLLAIISSLYLLTLFRGGRGRSTRSGKNSYVSNNRQSGFRSGGHISSFSGGGGSFGGGGGSFGGGGASGKW